MPINFSELVDRIEQRNLQNRQQMVAQIKPFLDVLTRKATYELEKRKAAEETATGLSEAAKTIGIDFTPNTSLTPDMQKFTFNLEADRQAPRKQWEAFSSVYGVQIPENIKDMTPEQATVSLAKAKEEYSTIEAVNDTLSLYPELAQKLMADPKFSQADAKLKMAMLDKELGDEAAKKSFAQKVAMKKIETDENIRQYWSTTGALAQQKIEQDNASPKMTAGQVQAMSRKKLYETQGINLHGYKVKIAKQAGNKIAITTINGKSIKKTPDGYWILSNDGKWRELIIDPDNKDNLRYKRAGVIKDTVYRNAAKALDTALTDYDLQTGNSLEPLSGEEPQVKQQQQTNTIPDELFKGLK